MNGKLTFASLALSTEEETAFGELDELDRTSEVAKDDLKFAAEIIAALEDISINDTNMESSDLATLF